MRESKVKHILLDNSRTYIIGAVYQSTNEAAERNFIAVEKSSSLGFTTSEKARDWLVMVHKSQPLTPADGTYKMIPEDVKQELNELLDTIKISL